MPILTTGLASIVTRHGILKAVARLHLYPTLALLGASGLLVAMSLHYPLATTFPIGGDAASHIRVAQTIQAITATPHDAWVALKTSNYPLAQILFAVFGTLPLAWPESFVWWMAAGHILTGAALGL